MKTLPFKHLEVEAQGIKAVFNVDDYMTRCESDPNFRTRLHTKKDIATDTRYLNDLFSITFQY